MQNPPGLTEVEAPRDVRQLGHVGHSVVALAALWPKRHGKAPREPAELWHQIRLCRLGRSEDEFGHPVGLYIVSHSQAAQRKVFTTPLLSEVKKRRNTNQFTKKKSRCQRGGVHRVANQQSDNGANEQGKPNDAPTTKPWPWARNCSSFFGECPARSNPVISIAHSSCCDDFRSSIQVPQKVL